MRFSFLFFLVVISPVFGQSSGSGRTTITGTLDTRQPHPAVQGPSNPVRRPRQILPPAELAARQQELIRQRPSLVVPPGVEKVDLLARGQAPSYLGGQSLAMNATRSFAGIPWTFFEPPSPDVAVGPVDVLQTAHSQIARYNKNGQKLSQVSLQQWFASILPQVCPSGAQNCNMFDPSIRYDSLHGRFLILAFSEDAGDIFSPTYGMSHFVLSVSNGATYESGFRHWAFRGNLNGSTPTPYELDYPQMGYDNNCVYLTGNMWDPNDLIYGKIRILKKSELYRESTTAVTYKDIWDLKNEDGSVAYTIRPAQVRGAPGTGTPPGILVNASLILNANYLTLWRIPNPTGDNPTAQRTTLRSVWPYDFPADFQTLGTVVALGDGADSAVLKAIQRNGILYTARNAGYPTATTTVTYDRIDLARNAVTFQARLVGGNYFFPAFDMPASQAPGNTVLDKLITGSSTDANGALTYAGVPGVKDGEDVYYAHNGRY
ncbi:MAG: hypothetical protein JNK87_23585, partial [Bryobacterales bacterium]|nr:hypothetical protein [Bryobacterales bacterium]